MPSTMRPQRAGSKRQLGEDSDFELDDDSYQDVGSPEPPSSRKKSRRAGSKGLGPTQYHGVTHHVRSNRFEARKKGRQGPCSAFAIKRSLS